jgi:hypothetical protein
MKYALEKHEITTKYYFENHKERSYVCDLSIDRIIILK